MFQGKEPRSQNASISRQPINSNPGLGISEGSIPDLTLTFETEWLIQNYYLTRKRATNEVYVIMFALNTFLHGLYSL